MNGRRATAARPEAGRFSGRGREIAVLLALLVLAALLRLPDLAARGPWDADQGEQMLAIRAMVAGQIPLIGPPTSTGGIPHGPAFYYLVAPLALPSGGDDPTAVTFGIALGGIATVGLVWWLARSAGGPVAGAVAGLLVAVSAHMVDASVRLWNPAFVAPGAALALAAAVEAQRRDDPRWWPLAAVGFVVAAQSHVLAWVLAAPVGLFVLADLRRSGRRAVPWLAAAAGIVVLSFVPLTIHEITSGFGAIRALLEAGGQDVQGGATTPWLLRLFFVPLRVLSVPLVRDVLAAVAVTTGAAALVVGAGALAAQRSSGFAPPARLLGVGLVLGIAGLAVGAPWLATVTPLYVDHYHLALDPIVFTLLGMGAAVMWRRAAGRVVVVAVVAAIAAWNLAAVPLPAVNADGGWPAGLAAGQRVVAVNGDRPAAIAGSPQFKKTTAVDYPVTVLGYPPTPAADATRVTVLCDALFEEVVGLACRGPAEAARLAEVGIAAGPLVSRFEAAPGRWISIYEIAGR